MPFPHKPKHRSYDEESGMNRTRPSGKAKNAKPTKRAPPPPPPAADTSEDDDYSQSEAEEYVQAKYKDDSRRPKTTVTRTKTERGAPQQERANNEEADHKDVEHVAKPEAKPGSSGFALLLAMTRQTIPVPIQFHEVNTYVPDCGNMFAAVLEIGDNIALNTKLSEICPDFTTIGLSLYYAHVYYFQILRARDEIGTLTRFERRSLRIYESIGRPESWPIAGPLTGFVQALGSAESPDRMFSIVSPAFPNFSQFTADRALHDVNRVDGIGRTPIVPATQEMLRLYGQGNLYFDSSQAIYTPVETPLNSTTRSFLGIEGSTATSLDFQTLAFSNGWLKPCESEEPVGFFSTGQRQSRVRRWAIPTIQPNLSFTSSMETYLFTDQNQVRWMSNLLRLSNCVNQFFPASTNLGAIPAITRMETFSKVSYSATASRTLTANTWYPTRESWKLRLEGKTFGDESIPFLMCAAATSTNTDYATSVIPTAIATAFTPNRAGPYFNASTVANGQAPLTQCESLDRHDPVIGLHELIHDAYDNRALE